MLNKKIRNFTIVDFPNNNNYYGNFIGEKPKNAADKVFSFLINFIDKKSNNNVNDEFSGKFLVFVIKDIESKKEYKYIGSRIKLKNPVKYIKNGKEIYYIYKNVIGVYHKELEKI